MHDHYGRKDCVEVFEIFSVSNREPSQGCSNRSHMAIFALEKDHSDGSAQYSLNSKGARKKSENQPN